jgi:hypothetical protein
VLPDLLEPDLERIRAYWNGGESIAKAVLHEAVKIALGPGNKRTKMTALKVVLDYGTPKGQP